MGLKINAYIFGIVISLWIYGALNNADGLSVFLGEIFYTLVLLNFLIFINKKRQQSNHYFLFGILETFIFLIFFNSLFNPFSAHCLCIFEIFSIDLGFYELIFAVIILSYFGYIYLKGSSKKEKHIGILIFVVILLNHFWSNIVYIYNEAFIITRFPTNIGNNRNYRGYSKTREGVFNEAIKKITIPGADLDSFIGLNSLYAKDKNSVYFLDKKIENADTGTFQLINTDDQLTESVNIISKEGSSYGAFFNGGYAKDKNSVYFYGKKLDHSDPDTFVILGNWYAKDKNSKFYKGQTDYRRYN